MVSFYSILLKHPPHSNFSWLLHRHLPCSIARVHTVCKQPHNDGIQSAVKKAKQGSWSHLLSVVIYACARRFYVADTARIILYLDSRAAGEISFRHCAE